MKKKKLPIGEADFKEVITGPYYYVDKSLFIQEVIDCGDKILLIPRPRRFGKTLNMSMLAYFYTCCPFTGLKDEVYIVDAAETPPRLNYTPLFAGLAIQHAGQEYLDKLGQYPVIFFSFKDIKDPDWESSLDSLKKLIKRVYRLHDYLLESPQLKLDEINYFQSIINLQGSTSDYAHSLESLLLFLNRHFNQRVVILIDEYDAPVLTGYNNRYFKEIIDFMRVFLGSGLKDTGQYLEKAVVTGVMRITKESIFSGFNNPGVYTLLSSKFSGSFGFTESEVQTMLADFDVLHMLPQVQSWYNGYRFGSQIIYNPWSIIKFLDDENNELAPYWINTSDNSLVDSLLTQGGKELKEELELLIRGETIEKIIDQNIILQDVATREDFLWAFLLMGGYLKQTGKRQDEDSGDVTYSLAIPNKEVRSTYTAIIKRYFTEKLGNKKMEIMLKALIEGDIKLFEELLIEVVLKVYSYHDFGNEPERVYHALVAGLLVWISNTHEVKSNRESGYGRYDIMIIPKDTTKIGYVIEFKTVNKRKKETVKSALAAALAQIEKRQYATELQERGITRITQMAIAFSGKKVYVETKGAGKD